MGHIAINCHGTPRRQLERASLYCTEMEPVVDMKDPADSEPVVDVKDPAGSKSVAEQPGGLYGGFLGSGTLNGQLVTVLRDTGCSLSLVKSNLVRAADINPTQTVHLLSAFGMVEDAPLAHVTVECNFFR